MTAAQTDENDSIRNECLCYMLDVVGIFCHKEMQQMLVSFGMNAKGGMDDDEFFEYLQNLIMPLYPDSAPMNGKKVVLKCDSGPGRLNETCSQCCSIMASFFSLAFRTRQQSLERQTRTMVRS